MTTPITRAAELHNVMAVLEHRKIISKPKPERQKKTKRVTKIDKEDILSRRSSWLCDCGCGKPGHDLHHAFIGRKTGVPELDDERNLVLVNHDEHIARTFDNREWRKKFWVVQLKRYGIDRMADWLSSIPDKYYRRMDWFGHDTNYQE